jgi:hypothetical protein
MSEQPQDVDALKARLAELEQENATLASKKRLNFDGRSFGAWTVLVVAALLFPIALTAFWAQRTLTDTERYIATVAPLADDPSVQQAVGETVTNAITKQLDAQNRVNELLTDYPRLQPLAGPIASGVNSLVERTVDQFLASDQFKDLWRTINVKLQQGLVRALEEKEGGAVTIADGQVVLDTGDLIEIVKQRLVDRGLTFAANIPVPPVADRTVVLLDSPELKRAQFFYGIAQPAAQWLIYLVLLMFVGAILLSRNRPRMTVAVGVALILGAVLIRLGLVVAQDQVSYSLQGTAFALAERAFFTILTVFLIDGVRAAFVLGLILILVGWFLSRGKAATAVRTWSSGLVSGAGARAADGPLAEIGGFVHRTRTLWRVVVVGIGAGIVLLSDQVTGSLLLWTTFFVVLALIVVELLSAAGRPADDAVEAPEEPEPAQVDA